MDRTERVKYCSLTQRKEWLISMGKQSEDIKLRRQTKLDQWIVGQQKDEDEHGISEPCIPIIIFQMGGRIHDVK